MHVRKAGLIVALLVGAPAFAADPGRRMPAMDTASCPGTPAPLPAGFAGWSQPVGRYAAASAASAREPLPMARAVRLRLASTTRVTYPSTPDRPGDAHSYGGVAAIVAPRAGRYQIALSSGAWVDVVRGGKALRLAGHDHGPACSGIRKLVAFNLAPGRYLLQVVNNYDPQITLMIQPAS